MKTKFLFLAIFVSLLSISQNNRSNGTIITNFATAVPPQFTAFGTIEAFRFRPGLVTQFQSGTGFDFTSSWFSLGNINTGTQTAYGLRFQLPNRSVLFGYDNITANVNPRIQWIGTGANLGNLEFRVATSFTNNTSTLVASMTPAGSTLFGNFSPSGLEKVAVQNDNAIGILVRSQPSSIGFSTGITIENQNGSGTFSNTGIELVTLNGNENKGVRIKSGQGQIQSFGIEAFAYDSVNSDIGLKGTTFGNAPFQAGIYGETAQQGNQWAGFFDGDVFCTTGNYVGSDRKLKENIAKEENVLEKIKLLNPVNYTYKATKGINLNSVLQHGFIAQELEEVYPELVKSVSKPIFNKDGKVEGNLDFKSVNYIGLISVLTSAVKELNEEVNVLKEKIESSAARPLVLSNTLTKNQLDELAENSYSMEQNVPNPFTDRSEIVFNLPKGIESGSIIVFDMTGKMIKEYKLNENKGKVLVNANEVGKGLFLYSLVIDNQEIITKKMIIK